jgi:hypothetical protein
LTPGALIFSNADTADALAAIGVVLRKTPSGIRGVLKASATNGPLHVRDHGQIVTVTLAQAQ